MPTLAVGGIGVISVLSNIKPKYTVEMINKYLEGKNQEAAKMQIKATKLINLLFKEVNPIPIKFALNIKIDKIRLTKPNKDDNIIKL